MKLPVLWLALAFGAGTVLEGLRQAGTEWWLSVTLLLILSALVFAWRKFPTVAWSIALCAWVTLGGLAAHLERNSGRADNIARLFESGRLDASEPLRWHGRLRSDPESLPWGVRYEFDLESVEREGAWIAASGGLRANYYFHAKNREILPALRAGDRVEALMKARLPRNFLDPGAFDERGFLAREGIHLTGSLRSVELLQKLETPSLPIAYRLARLRGNLIARIDKLFVEDTETSTVLRAMLLGDRSFADTDLATIFQKTAAYHVLVLAGLHVGALCVFIFWLCRRLHVSPATTMLITLCVLIFYVSVVQERPPILRAALMAAIYLAGRAIFRRVELLNTVGLAALILLIWRPRSLTDASFQLSFLAAGVIAGLALPWMDRTSSPYQAGLEHLGDVTRDRNHPAKVIQFRLDLRAMTNWLRGRLPASLADRAASFVSLPLRAGLHLWKIILLSAVIQWGLLPLLALYFHRVSLVGPLSNVPAVLITGVIVPLGFAMLLASALWWRLAEALAGILGTLVKILIWTAKWFSGLGHASYRIPGPPAGVLVAFFLILPVLMIFARTLRGRRGRILRTGELISATALVAVTLLAATYPFKPRLSRGQMEVTVLDVGQGDSLFVALPDGATMLIDGGGLAGEFHEKGRRSGRDVGEDVVSAYLWSRGVKRLDVVALTHAHHDHLDGLHSVLINFRVGELWVGRDVRSTAYAQLLSEAAERGIPMVHHIRGDAFASQGVNIKFLWPPDSALVNEASNDDSLVIQFGDGQEKFLLTGDIEKKTEGYLVSQGDALTADFLKAAHHGSKTSSTLPFITAVGPRYAVISVGANNSFGQPNPEVLAHYTERGVRVLETDRDGAVTALTDGRTLTIRSFLTSLPR
ncbi:MAG: ComEC/Rec2 family competence protein [Candidatus Acidiferrales bacterium]